MKPPINFRKTVKDQAVLMEFQTFKDHKGMAERLRKTLYYGKRPQTDRPSLPMTELAVEYFSKAVPEGLGQIDLDYAATVSRNACMSPCSLILAMAYIERLRHRSPDYLQQVSSSDLFLVSVMVASKFLYDEGENEEVFNDEWAVSGNLEPREVNQLERQFLSAIDWNVYMNSSAFAWHIRNIEYQIALRKSKDRGWSTYTDLNVLTEHWKLAQCCQLLMESFVKVVTVSAIAYAASVLAMVGAVVIAHQAKQQAVRIMEGSSENCFVAETNASTPSFGFNIDSTPFSGNVVDCVWSNTQCQQIFPWEESFGNACSTGQMIYLTAFHRASPPGIVGWNRFACSEESSNVKMYRGGVGITNLVASGYDTDSASVKTKRKHRRKSEIVCVATNFAFR